MRSRFFLAFLSLLSVVFLATQAAADSSLAHLFSVKKPVMVALFLQTLSGDDLRDEQKKREMIDYAKSQMDIIKAEGGDAVLWEFRAGGILTPEITDEQLNWMADILSAIVAYKGNLQVGVEILWHYPKETLKLAALGGASFVRVDFFSDDMIADDIRVPIDPEGLIQYKSEIGAQNVVLFTDIQVKYATMIDPNITMTQSAITALGKGSNGVIVSGTQSGSSPDTNRVRLAKVGAPKDDVIIGSGFSASNASALLQYADGVIVGTSISVQTGGPLVPEKVRELMAVVKSVRNGQ